MNKYSNVLTKQAGVAAPVVIAILAVLVVIGGVVYFVKGEDSTRTADSNVAAKNYNAQSKPTAQNTETQVIQPEPEVVVDADTFCEQIAKVGVIFGEELTGATTRTNVSNGPQVGCSWSGPYVLVYFGKGSYDRRNKGFGSENLVEYQSTDLEAVKREKYAVHSGFEVEVKSDKGIAFRISQSTGRQTDLTPEQYNQIANIVNDVLNKHY